MQLPLNQVQCISLATSRRKIDVFWHAVNDVRQNKTRRHERRGRKWLMSVTRSMGQLVGS